METMMQLETSSGIRPDLRHNWSNGPMPHEEFKSNHLKRNNAHLNFVPGQHVRRSKPYFVKLQEDHPALVAQAEQAVADRRYDAPEFYEATVKLAEYAEKEGHDPSVVCC